MGKEIRVYGDPGSGKTGKLANEIVPNLIEKYGNDKVMLTSFTKAAAKELSSRVKDIDPSMVGTLHSFCFRALKQPALTEKYLSNWDEEYPNYAFYVDKSVGKECMSRYQIYRNKMVPEEKWSPDVQAFANAWVEWKMKYAYMDFIDIIEEGGQFFSPPGSPSAIVVDEAQDFTKLEMKLIRQWGSQVQELWLVGDANQTIFSFSGASASNMIYPEIDKEQKIYLTKSWRVPSLIHAIGQRIIKRVKVREEEMVSVPRDAEGKVSYGNDGYTTPAWVVKKALENKGTSMILTSCNYMLHPVIQELRNKGVPFSNPWRKEEKAWNPLNTLGTDVLKFFLNTGEDNNYWSAEQFVYWAESLKVGPDGLIRKQGRAGIKRLKEIMEQYPDMEGLHTCREFIEDILSPDAVKKALSRDTEWLYQNLIKAKQTTISYAMRVYQKQGHAALFKTSNIFVGTIHSTKGAEADNVFLYPDISYASSKEAEYRDGYDNLCRLFYVGVTRAKEQLILMPQCTKNFFEI
jgi:DNA helicase II / ATP-dependent DNA helicase PcrA